MVGDWMVMCESEPQRGRRYRVARSARGIRRSLLWVVRGRLSQDGSTVEVI